TYLALEKLAANGSAPCSALSKRTLRKLQPLLDSGVLAQRTRGRGMILEVVDDRSLRAFAGNLFPHGARLISDHAPSPREEAVALFRDSKRARRTSAEPVLIRAIAPAAASCREKALDLKDLTDATGAACLLIADDTQWRIEADIAVIENLEVFLHFERLDPSFAVAIYAGGRLSRRVIDWLASDPMSQCRFRHCGDYDPVGLDEYIRLRKQVGPRATLYVPDNIEELFRRYGKRRLLTDSASALARLRKTPFPEVRRLVDFMDQTGCGLEQEALLCKADTEQRPEIEGG
ncbi:MAG: DUF7281 domain-containing protein, partial [Verrucomicrobiota bacterium]